MINENIDWSFDIEEDDNIVSLPYLKNGINYGRLFSLYQYDGYKKNFFNLEDKIICDSGYDGNSYIKNKIGHVVDYSHMSRLYLIYFDEHINGHKASNIPHGHAWWVSPYFMHKK